MNYLSVEKLSKSYGDKILFDNISFGIEKGQKTAIIARNGTGKTTLLNIIAGVEFADEGQVVKRNDLRISYLPQMDNLPQHYAVIDTIFETETPITNAIKTYEKAVSKLATQNSRKNQEALEKAIMEMDRLSAWDFENRVKEILSKFGIQDIFKNVHELSGGERKKTAIAKTLLSEADFLILDEPTNHIDIEMIEWIEEYLSAANITLLMVTHDRFFLDRVCNSILELENGNLYPYKGKYDYFLEKKMARLLYEEVQQEKLKSLYEKELAWVKTSPQARTTKAKARINAFEKIKKEALTKPKDNTLSFSIKTERLGNKILEINNLDFSYPNLRLINDFSYIFKRGEKCGIVGKNGTGKSTLLKLIIGELKADKGKISPGLTSKFGYFSQDTSHLDNDKRIIDLVKEKAEIIKNENGDYISASQFLYNFGFNYEQQYAYCANLSGGEKRKLHLLTVLMQNPNFLILDEPTNDFDIDTLNILEDFLTQFEGCLLIVSHDRWFMNKLVEHLFVFEGNGQIKDYYGNYTEYKSEKDKQRKSEKRRRKNENYLKKEVARPTTNAQKLNYKEKKELKMLEEEIENLEGEKSEILEKMNDSSHEKLNILTLSQRYQEVEKRLDEKTTRWFTLKEKEDS